MLDWIVVGGGVHGTYISNYLIKLGGTSPDKLRVIDPHEAPLSIWKRCTHNTGMEYLRSPGEHNIDVGPGALIRFALQRPGSGSQLYSKFNRPTLRLFNAHCDHVIDQRSLESLRYRASALSLQRTANGFILHTDCGELESKRVILSIGASDCLSIPVWAESLRKAGAPVYHVFSEDFASYRKQQWSKAVVIGGGISGAQLALDLSKERPGKVVLIHARKLQTYQFDADPCWLDSRCLKTLRREADFAERRRIVERSRHWGSFPEEIRKQLDAAIKREALSCVEGNVVCALGDSNSIELELSTGAHLECDFVALATGFERCLPGGKFLQTTIKTLELNCAPCGFPKTDEFLRWSDGLFVTGPLAELVIGPASRNIIGARLAAERIFKAIRPARSKPREHNYYYFQKRRRG